MRKKLAAALSAHTFRSRPLEFKLRASPPGDQSRGELLRKVRAGEVVELDVEICGYTQPYQPGEAPNSKHVRFATSALERIAKTAVGAVFIRDHQQRDVLARGGTVVDARFDRDDGARVHVLRMRVQVVKPWAVEGLLDGTIDRFSISFVPTGPIVYAHNREEISNRPEYFPGDKLSDGTIVEWELTDAKITELSAVNIPAADGTEVEDCRVQLSALLGPDEPAPVVPVPAVVAPAPTPTAPPTTLAATPEKRVPAWKQPLEMSKPNSANGQQPQRWRGTLAEDESPSAPAEELDALRGRVATLEAENAQLRSQLAPLRRPVSLDASPPSEPTKEPPAHVNGKAPAQKRWRQPLEATKPSTIDTVFGPKRMDLPKKTITER